MTSNDKKQHSGFNAKILIPYVKYEKLMELWNEKLKDGVKKKAESTLSSKKLIEGQEGYGLKKCDNSKDYLYQNDSVSDLVDNSEEKFDHKIYSQESQVGTIEDNDNHLMSPNEVVNSTPIINPTPGESMVCKIFNPETKKELEKHDLSKNASNESSSFDSYFEDLKNSLKIPKKNHKKYNTFVKSIKFSPQILYVDRTTGKVLLHNQALDDISFADVIRMVFKKSAAKKHKVLKKNERKLLKFLKKNKSAYPCDLSLLNENVGENNSSSKDQNRKTNIHKNDSSDWYKIL